VRSKDSSQVEKKTVPVIARKVRPQSAPSMLSHSNIRKSSLIVPETVPIAQLQMDTLNCPNYTSAEYWDTMGKDWEGEIMSSLDEDVNGVIKQCLDNYVSSRPSSLAVDFGCGVGLYVPSLSTRYENVVGLDISRRLIARARRDCENKGITNARFKRADLGTCDISKIGLSNAADLAVCANVLISPEPQTRLSILANVAATLRPDGYLLLVVPACRSALLCQEAHGVWLAERRRLKVKAHKKSDEFPEATSAADERRGIFRRDGVRTKHFRASEVRGLLEQHALEVVTMDRVEYDWLTEFKAPVDILNKKFNERPFDWIVIAKKNMTQS
jgi:SAM-dependent methyltransferase